MLRILFTYPETLPHETRFLENVMQEDWDFLHVRKPDYSKEEMIQFLELIPQFHHKVVLHSHFELIRHFELAGVNINRKAFAGIAYKDELTSACDIRELTVKDGKLYVYGLRPDLVSYSGHGFKEVQGIPFKTDYVFLSPIFNSISKQGYESGFDDPEILSAFLKKEGRKMIALGGIDNTKIPICETLGFDGYAMLGNIWKKYRTFVETI